MVEPEVVVGPQERGALTTALRHAAETVTAESSMRDLEAMLTKLVHAAVATVPGADGGGISRTEQNTVRSSHATRADVFELDQLQSHLGEGPCITAADDPPADGLVVVRDLRSGADAARWPRFAPAAVEAGYCSMLSVGLSLGSRRRSALNLYAGRADAYDESARWTAGLFGLQAAALLHGADHADQLGNALASRDVIGQAKGMLMERFAVDGPQAFQMLVSASQDSNIKLVAVAEWLVGEGPRRTPQRAAEVGPAPTDDPDAVRER